MAVAVERVEGAADAVAAARDRRRRQAEAAVQIQPQGEWEALMPGPCRW